MWKAVLDYDIQTGTDRLFLFGRDLGSSYFVGPLEIIKCGSGEVRKPALQDIREAVEDGGASVRQFMQAILDEAWSNGLRPTGQPDPTNELTAVRYHLEDMRTLAKVK